MGTSKGHGKYIETPEKMWEYFEAYRAEVKNNPRTKTVFPGKDAIPQREPLERPLTLEGFENWCADAGIIEDLSNYFANTKGNYSDYSTICSRIKRVIRQDQIEGGMVGQYNASITQRLNSLVDKQENQVFIEQWIEEDE
jgi:DNA-packaging protein gp3